VRFVRFVVQLNRHGWATARSAEVAALAGYHKALSTLRFTEARILDASELTVEVQ